MNGETIEKARSWATPVLLGLIAALIAILGTTSLRTLDRIEEKIDQQDVRIQANALCCVELRTRAAYGGYP